MSVPPRVFSIMRHHACATGGDACRSIWLPAPSKRAAERSSPAPPAVYAAFAEAAASCGQSVCPALDPGKLVGKQVVDTGCFASTRSTSKHMILPDPSQMLFTGISRYRRGSSFSSQYPTAECLHRLRHERNARFAHAEFCGRKSRACGLLRVGAVIPRPPDGTTAPYAPPAPARHTA